MAVQYSYVMKGLTKTFPGAAKPVLDNIHLQFLPGTKIAIIGKNGAGKSTLMKIMAGQDDEFQGEAWAGEGIRGGYQAKEPELDDTKTVWDNVMSILCSVAELAYRFNELSNCVVAPPYDVDIDGLTDDMGTQEGKIDEVVGKPLYNQHQIAKEALRCPPRDSESTDLSG